MEERSRPVCTFGWSGWPAPTYLTMLSRSAMAICSIAARNAAGVFVPRSAKAETVVSIPVMLALIIIGLCRRCHLPCVVDVVTRRAVVDGLGVLTIVAVTAQGLDIFNA